jgi:hypothetical protein
MNTENCFKAITIMGNMWRTTEQDKEANFQAIKKSLYGQIDLNYC